jgi:NAD(P)-dependent dehydrogenase (short-subunit alcohol dehydrogenase family)
MANTAIVTGAASGIGLEACRDLLERGWTVYGLDMTDDGLEKAAATLGDDAFHYRTCDLREAEAVAKTMAEIGEAAGSINSLIACAGVLKLGPLAGMSVEDFDMVFDVNVRGLWLSAKEAMPMLRKAADAGELARVILLSSVSALRPKIDSGAYSASKAAVSQLTRVLAVECAEHGILVNALAPGTVDTPMVNNQGDPAKSGKWRPSGPSPIGRIAQPSDIVRVMRFLLSEDAAYVTGATIPVDGGTQAAFVPPR